MSKGRIHPDDIAMVRERTPIEEVVAARVTLRRVGSGLSGLCPFHDESSPSFNVSPNRGLYHCFGCGEGGDVIAFVQKTEGLSFVEAVEKLADKAGIELRYLGADPSYQAPPPGQRARLLDAHRVAQAFYLPLLHTADGAELGRKYLEERGFTDADITSFEIGYAPKEFDGLLKTLKAKGFTEEEAVLSGLAVKNDNGKVYDRFRGRLVWPIRDQTGEIIGYGARRLSEDDKGPKWLNTPETPIYHKSEVLYGIDRARKAIAADRVAVIVEGYGDVMAMHLSGVPYAVATCGTAFGESHTKVVRRLLRDDTGGRVIFTFDGDEPGQKAALRAFKENNKFASQTYVAIAPDNMDPLDLRLQRGDDAVRALVASAVPLVEFVLKSTMKSFDLASSEGRTNALRTLAPIVGDIKDPVLRAEYVRQVAGWLALPEHSVSQAVAWANKQKGEQAERDAAWGEEVAASRAATAEAPVVVASLPHPNPADPTLANEREALKCLLQSPVHARQALQGVGADTFTHPTYRAVYEAVMAAPAPSEGHETQFVVQVADSLADPMAKRVVSELAVEVLKSGAVGVSEFVHDVLLRLRDRDMERQISGLKVRMNQVAQAEQMPLLQEIMGLEKQRRDLRHATAVESVVVSPVNLLEARITRMGGQVSVEEVSPAGESIWVDADPVQGEPAAAAPVTPAEAVETVEESLSAEVVNTLDTVDIVDVPAPAPVEVPVGDHADSLLSEMFGAEYIESEEAKKPAEPVNPTSPAYDDDLF